MYGLCGEADRSGYVFPVFEYCHYDYFSDLSSEDVYTNENDICGDRLVVGNTVIGEILRRIMENREGAVTVTPLITMKKGKT